MRRAARWPHSVRWRLTGWYAAALAAGLLVFAAASLVVLARVLESRSDHFLLAARQAFITELLVEAREQPTPETAIAAALREVHFEEIRFTVTAAAPLRAGHEPPAGANIALRTVDGDGAGGGRRRAVGPVAFDGRWWTVTAEHGRRGIQETVGAVAAAYAVGVPLLLLISVIGGYMLAQRALAPVAAMSRRAQAINAANLHDRLPVADPHDELGELAGVVNALLDRLEAAFAQQRRFVTDASHELRTPVAILRAEADVALARTGRSEAAYREAIGVLRDAGARLARIVDDLFLLARADSGRQPVRHELLYLDELVADGVRAMQAVAGARGVQITSDTCEHHATADPEADPDGEASVSLGAPFTGDPALLDRLLLNLLDNAVKHSAPGSTVRVALRRETPVYRLAIGDEGPGIPPEAVPHLFERFFRVDRTRVRDAATAMTGSAGIAAADPDRAAPSGAGLGLALCRWIAEAHGGALTLARTSPAGSEFVVTLPIPPVPVASPAPPAGVAAGGLGSAVPLPTLHP